MPLPRLGASTKESMGLLTRWGRLVEFHALLPLLMMRSSLPGAGPRRERPGRARARPTTHDALARSSDLPPGTLLPPTHAASLHRHRDIEPGPPLAP
jgi:hypothetical protein